MACLEKFCHLNLNLSNKQKQKQKTPPTSYRDLPRYMEPVKIHAKAYNENMIICEIEHF